MVLSRKPADIHSFTETAEQLYRKNYNGVYHSVNALLQDKFMVDDIVHEAFLKAFKNLSQLQDIGKFRPWVGTIALNLCRDHFHKAKREIPTPEIYEEDYHANLEDEILNKLERNAHFEAALRSLKYDDREILILRYCYELPNKDIARYYQITIEATYVRVFRAKERFKSLYAKIQSGNNLPI